jgi:putative serine/threonine protein kinase
LTETVAVLVTEAMQSNYARILTYPRSDEGEVKARISELSGIGVTELRFSGVTHINGIPVLGKGCVGIVVEAVLNGELVALKIRRMDADRPSMRMEGRLLRLANSVEVGPHLITSTRNFLVMELFRGIPLFRWAQSHRVRSKKQAKDVFAKLLQFCFRLDSIGLDHGELSHAPKNVLVGRSNEPCIVDFESASAVRRVANVTSLVQYFLFGRISKELKSANMFPNRGRTLKALATYKRDVSVETFENVLRVLRLL